MVFPLVIYGCESWTIKKAEHRRIDALNCGVEKDSLESLGQQGDPTSPSQRKSVLNIHWKHWCWSWNSNTLATWCKELTVVFEKILESLLDSKEIKPDSTKRNQPWIFTGRTDAEPEAPVLWLPDAKESTHRNRSWCLERLETGEEDDRGSDSWMASPTQWTWAWATGRWWKTVRRAVVYGVTKSQTQLNNWTTTCWIVFHHMYISYFLSIVWSVAYHMIYAGECHLCTWENCIFCYFWVEYSVYVL